MIANSYPPYRVYLHERILEEVPEIELWSVATHSNSYERWTALRPPESIRPVEFSHGEPTNVQPLVRHSLREWRKAGRIIRWMNDRPVAAAFVQGCGDVGRLRIIRWCRRHGIPCFLTGDFNIRSDNHRGFKRWLKRRVYNRGVGWSYGLLPCGECGLALLNRYGGRGKPQWAFPFVPDFALFQDPPAERVDCMRERFGFDQRRRRLVFSARMMSAKRPDLAIAAFVALAEDRPQWDLVMIGDGPLRAELERRTPANLRARITWTGFLENGADVAGIYAQCDVLLLPSQHEPWGVVVVEGVAAGLAVVASDQVGASPELVRQGVNGATFPAGDVAGLTLALRDVTHPAVIDSYKARSPEVLRAWLAACDPVKSFRAALVHCDVISPHAVGMPLAEFIQRVDGAPIRQGLEASASSF